MTGSATLSGRPPSRQPALRRFQRPPFDVAHAEEVLVNGASHGHMDDALGLGVVPQQIAFVVGQFALALRYTPLSKK
jgi:hypothetical protein